MQLTDARTGIEVIGRDECVELLQHDVNGRLALAVHGAPSVVPVNYAMDGDVVVFRTAPGTKLAAAGRAPACFEIDGFDREQRTGWSVVVTGRLEEVTEAQTALLHRLQALGVSPWADGARDHVMRIAPSRITGRRVGPRPTTT
jgi:nitroimidazol reductase NimA-like FMN-containing flavoprotein (pyridoxamine 5'-phosphate oxidase superfamily)